MKIYKIPVLSHIGMLGLGLAIMVLLTKGSGDGQEPPPDVGLVTQLSGEVTYTTEVDQEAEVNAVAFMKIRQGDRLKLSPRARLVLLYFANGRQETWNGPVSLIVENETSQAAGINKSGVKPKVKIFPEKVIKKIDGIKPLFPRGRTNRPGHMKVRGDSAKEELQVSPISKILDKEAGEEIQAAKTQYLSLKEELGPEDPIPELFLLSVLAEHEKIEDMKQAIRGMLEKYPGNVALKTLEDLLENQSVRSPKHTKKHALLIGISDYEKTQFNSLDGPLNDLELVRGVLVERFGFKEENIITFTNARATHTALKAAFASLSERVSPGDFVYIHYSGHGSFTRDLNGDELHGKDQTWVSYGSRPKAPNNRVLDNFDVLDDEINEWLVPIHAKADQIVFISDSCHSASVTRGIAPKMRAVPIDYRPHPLGKKDYQKVKLTKGIRIGAAGDEESACEFESPDGKSYGLFTWFWAQALIEANPQETWNDVFKRAYSLVTSKKGVLQHPQIEGEGNRLVFGGSIAPPSKSIPVAKADQQGKTAQINAGLLSGVTRGSTFRLYSPLRPGDEPALLEITRVHHTYSIGKVLRGEFKPSYLVVEENHVYPFKPIKVFLNADFRDTEDKVLLEKISKVLEDLPQYQLTDYQRGCDMVIYVLRPKRKNNRPVYRAPTDTLPQSFPSLPPEVWLLSPVERMLHENLQIVFSDHRKGIALLKENLRIMARSREIKVLSASRVGSPPPVDIVTILLTPDDSCDRGVDCMELPYGMGHHRKEGPFSVDQIKDRRLKVGDILTFILKNTSGKDYYCYLLDLSPDGKVEAIFPDTGASTESALLRVGMTLDLSTEVGLRLEDPGQETVKLIATQMPIDISLLEQSGYTRGRNGDRPLNPLEHLLCNAMHGTRGAVSLRNDDWATIQFEIDVMR